MARKSKFEPGQYILKAKRSKAGVGLFTYSPIKKGECVVEYTGRVISKEEEYTNNSKYLFEIHKYKTIDGRARENIARYINHSCKPNCEVEIRKGRVFVMARRGIKIGEELFYDYGKDYFDEHIKKGGCRCEKCGS